jgi:hypothetical protein
MRLVAHLGAGGCPGRPLGASGLLLVIEHTALFSASFTTGGEGSLVAGANRRKGPGLTHPKVTSLLTSPPLLFFPSYDVHYPAPNHVSI